MDKSCYKVRIWRANGTTSTVFVRASCAADCDHLVVKKYDGVMGERVMATQVLGTVG